MSQTIALDPKSKAHSISAWTLQVLLGLVFVVAGGAKLSGAPMMIEIFDLIGIGQWFRIVTGLVEVAGAVALLIPGFTMVGAVWLGITMIFAVLTHAFILPMPLTSGAPAASLAVLAFVLAYLRRDQLSALKAKPR